MRRSCITTADTAVMASATPITVIAQRLSVGHPTVRFHLANAFRKFQTDNRAQLAARVQSVLDAHRRESGAAVRVQQPH